jgi:hypothetical protein
MIQQSEKMEDIVITIVSRLFVFGWLAGPLLAMAGRKVGPQSLLNIVAIPVYVGPHVLLALCGSVVVIRDALANEDASVWLNFTGAGAFIWSEMEWHSLGTSSPCTP